MPVNLAAIVDKPWPYVRGYLIQELGLGDRLDSRSNAFALGYLGQATGFNLRHFARFDKECGASYIPDVLTCHVGEGRSVSPRKLAEDMVGELIADTEIDRTSSSKRKLPEAAAHSRKNALINSARAAYNRYGSSFAKHLIVQQFGIDDDDLSDIEGQLNDSLFKHGVDQIDEAAAGNALAKSLGIQSDLEKIRSSRQKRSAKDRSVLEGAKPVDQAVSDYLDDYFKGMNKGDREEFTVTLADARKEHKSNFGKELLKGLLLGNSDENDPSTKLILAGISQIDSKRVNGYLLSQRQINSTAAKHKRKS